MWEREISQNYLINLQTCLRSGSAAASTTQHPNPGVLHWQQIDFDKFLLLIGQIERTKLAINPLADMKEVVHFGSESLPRPVNLCETENQRRRSMGARWLILLAIEIHSADLVMTFMLSAPTYRYDSQVNFRFRTAQAAVNLLFNVSADTFSHSSLRPHFIHNFSLSP